MQPNRTQLDGEKIVVDGVQKTPAFASISAATAGWTQLVSPKATKIRVIRYSFTVNGAVDVQFQSNTAAITGRYSHGSKGQGVTEPFCPYGHFEASQSQALGIDLSAGVTVGGCLTWVSVAA